MANLVKTKRSIFLGSTTIIALLWMAEFSWFKKEVIKKWDVNVPLVWSDFNGDIPWGTAFDAGISSKIYAVPGTSGDYYIYAGQNNLKSWTKHKRGMPQLLRHEQYHFHITELHARMLKQRWENKSMDTGFEELESEINASLVTMQDLYDKESDHGLIKSYQHLWEYQVDSMLSAFELNQGFYIDRLGAVKVWFPTKPEFEEERTNNYLGQCYLLNEYQADFRYCVFADVSYHPVTFLDFWKNSLAEKEVVVRSFDYSEEDTHQQIYIIYDDTISYSRYHQMAYSIPPFEYRMSVVIPWNDPDSAVYNRMKDSFLDHVTFSAQDDFWIDYAEQKNPDVYEHHFISANINDYTEENDSGNYKLSRLNFSDYSIMYHSPIIHENQLIIPFKVVRHPSQDVQEVLYMVNENRSFSQAPDSPYQVIKIDMDLLNTGRNKIQFGYTTFSDSTSKGHHFYSSIVEYEH